MNFFFKPNTSVQVPQSSISKSMSPFSAAPSLSKTSQAPGQDLQNGKPTVLITTLLIFYKLARALSLSGMFVEFSLKAVHLTMFGENFQGYTDQIIGKCIC